MPNQQSSQGMDLKNCEPKDVLEQEFLDEYKAYITGLGSQLTQLNRTMNFLCRINEFPFEDFFQTERIPAKIINLLQLIEVTLAESSVLIISRIALDADSRSLTLKNLREFLRHAVKDDYVAPLEAMIKKHQFGRKLKRIEGMIAYIRNKGIAHIDRKTPVPTLQAKDLQMLKNAVDSCYQDLCFGEGYSTLNDPQHLLVFGDEGELGAIEQFFDGLVKTSVVFNLPESNKERWLEYKAELPQRTLDHFNKYRIKFGMPQV